MSDERRDAGQYAVVCYNDTRDQRLKQGVVMQTAENKGELVVPEQVNNEHVSRDTMKAV